MAVILNFSEGSQTILRMAQNDSADWAQEVKLLMLLMEGFGRLWEVWVGFRNCNMMKETGICS